MALENTLEKTNSRVSDKTSKVFNHGNNKTGKLNGMMDSVSGIQKNVAGTIVGGGRIIARAAGALGASGLAKSLTGSQKTRYKRTNEKSYFSKLSEFYSRFSSPGYDKEDFVDIIDPMTTFECRFEFFPSVQSTLTKNVSVMVKSNEKEKTNTTIYSNIDKNTKILTSYSGNSIISKLLTMIKFKDISQDNKKYFEMQEKLLEEGEDNKFVDDGTDDSFKFFNADGSTIEKRNYKITNSANYLNFGIFIQKILIPNMSVQGTDETVTPIGKFPIAGNIVGADNNNLNMDIVNVRNPILEEIFYPWMRETTLPKWSYREQPFTTATITIKFMNSNVSYVFYGCRPTQIQLIQPDQAPSQSLTRNVTFAFDLMTIVNSLNEKETIYAIPGSQKKTKLGSGPSNGNSKSGLANSALFSAANTFRM